jgi:hypothetical protein
VSVVWPTSLVTDIARRRAVLVLGSGVSRQAQNAQGKNPPMWTECLNLAIDKLGGTATSKNTIRALMTKNKDLLTACEAIKETMGAPDFRQFMREQYLDPKFQHAPLHDSIINLDVQITATPNFDKIYDSRINALQSSSVAIKHYYDDDLVDILRTPGRFIVKIHGTIDKANEMIFTRTEYAQARNKHRSFYAVLESLIMTQTFVFLGCGLEDPDVRLLLEDHAFRYGSTRPHFFVLPKGHTHPQFRSIIEKSLNIKMLEYDKTGNHKLLKDSVDDLVLQVNAARQQMGTTLSW